MTPEEAKAIAGFLFHNLDQEVVTTRKVLAAMPQDQLNFKLGEKGRTAAELMWHTVQSECWFGKGVLNLNFGGWEEEGKPPSTVAEILVAFDREIPPMHEKLKAMTGEQLATPVNLMNAFNLPAVVYLGLLANHTIHHRGQLSTYLRAMNAHVPSIYGGSADEPFDASTTASA
jgi:uncharacterized damage-inducible protein DinB